MSEMLKDLSYVSIRCLLERNGGRFPTQYDINLELVVDHKGAHGTYLQVACSTNDVDMVMWLVRENADVDSGIADDNVLHWACCQADKKGRSDLVTFLLSFERVRELVNTPSSSGAYLVHATRSLSVMRMLIAVGADVNVLDRQKKTALMFAARCDHAHVMKLLLPLIDDIDACVESKAKKNEFLGFTALHFVCLRRGENADCVHLLLQYGACVNKKTLRGISPLMFAVRAASLKKVEVLLHWGAEIVDVDYYENTLFHWSFKTWEAVHERLFAFLLKIEVAPELLNKRNRDGKTPIFFANTSSAARMLVVAGSSVNDVARYASGQTVLMDACEYNCDGEFIDYLLPLVNDINCRILASDVGDSAECQKGIGKTALHVASRYGKPALVLKLLDAGASTDMRGCFDYTPLQIAVAFNSVDVVRLLVERGSDVSHIAKPNGETLLHSACFEHHPMDESEGIVAFLLGFKHVLST